MMVFIEFPLVVLKSDDFEIWLWFCGSFAPQSSDLHSKRTNFVFKMMNFEFKQWYIDNVSFASLVRRLSHHPSIFGWAISLYFTLFPSISLYFTLFHSISLYFPLFHSISLRFSSLLLHLYSLFDSNLTFTCQVGPFQWDWVAASLPPRARQRDGAVQRDVQRALRAPAGQLQMMVSYWKMWIPAWKMMISYWTVRRAVSIRERFRPGAAVLVVGRFFWWTRPRPELPKRLERLR